MYTDEAAVTMGVYCAQHYTENSTLDEVEQSPKWQELLQVFQNVAQVDAINNQANEQASNDNDSVMVNSNAAI